MPKDSNKTDSGKRPAYFHERVIRLLTRQAIANDIGADACWLLTVVALQEKVIGFSRPVTYSNEQLMPLCGFGSRRRLVTARKNAIESGWLEYEPGSKARAGRYRVMIPPQFADEWDGPIDECVDFTCNESKRQSSSTCNESKRKETLKRNESKHQAERQERTIHKNLNKSYVELVVSKYKEFHPRSKPGDAERKKIADRLRDGYSADDLYLAIEGCHLSPYHCGKNDQGRKYQSLELIVRNSTKVQQFIEAYEQHSTSQAGKKPEQTEAEILAEVCQ